MVSRYGSVRMIRHGDTEITNAIASGMMTARQAQMERDAMIRQRTQRSLMRVDIGRGGWSKRDYDNLIDSARLTYAQDVKAPTAARRILGGILGVYGLCVLAVRGYFNFENARWKGQ